MEICSSGTCSATSCKWFVRAEIAQIVTAIATKPAITMPIIKRFLARTERLSNMRDILERFARYTHRKICSTAAFLSLTIRYSGHSSIVAEECQPARNRAYVLTAYLFHLYVPT